MENQIYERVFNVGMEQLKLWTYWDEYNQKWYKAKEVAYFLYYPEPSKAIRAHVHDSNKKYWNEIQSNFENIPKRFHHDTIFVNEAGLLNLLMRSRNFTDFNFIMNFINAFGLSIDYVNYSRKQTIIEYILCATNAHFIGCKNFAISNYRIDLYFPEQRLAIECEENVESSGNGDCSGYIKRRSTDSIIARRNNIKSLLQCEIVHFNPDSKNFNVYKFIGDVFNKLYEIKYTTNSN